MQYEFTQRLTKTRSQQLQQGDGSTPASLLVSDDEVWAQTVGDCYKERIYRMEASYSRSYSLSSVSRAERAGTDPESIHDQVHALNESVQRQLEEGDRRYMKLYERHERDKQQWSQQIQSIE